MTTPTMHLQFLPNDGDEDEGLADAGIETFRDAPFAGVARESGQNSRDASVELPVCLEFDLIRIPCAEFPDLAAFKETLDACAARAEDRDDANEVQFFFKAIDLAKKDEFFALRISDEGTTGLVGPCIPGTPFHSLVKASGVSNKNDITSGGSFGIGKKAAFAVSDLHTVFYSTRYSVGDMKAFFAQGKCTLVSHEDNNGEKKRATGYWGEAGYLPISSESLAPAWLRRSAVGTTTVAVGFSAASDWKFKIAESLVRNFFAAIHRDELWFFVDERSIEIDSESLLATFQMAEIERAADAHGTREELDFSKVLYECLTSEGTKYFETEIQGLGKFKMHLLVRDGMPKRVAIIRNGMMITDNLGHFGDKLTHFPMYRDFVAIVEPTDVASRSTIKRLENPRHDQLSVERLISESEQKSVRASMNALKKWIRESIRSEAFVQPVQETTLDEMNEFFGDVSRDDRIPDPNGGDPNPLAITYKPTKAKRSPTSFVGKDMEEEGGGGGANESSGGTMLGEGPGKGSSTGGSGGGEDLSFADFRNVPDATNPDQRRILFFTPLNDGVAQLSVYAKGMNDDVYFSKKSSYENEKGKSVKMLILKKGMRRKITVEFADPYRGPIGIRLTSDSKGESHETE